jgi:hypothetical protein
MKNQFPFRYSLSTGFFSRYIWTSQLTGTVTSLHRYAQHAGSNDLLRRQDGGLVLADILKPLDELNRDFSTEQVPTIVALHNEIDDLVWSRKGLFRLLSTHQNEKLVEARDFRRALCGDQQMSSGRG